MEFKKAKQSDLIDIFEVYKATIKKMNDMGIHQWDEIYPTIDDIKQDIEKEEMYIGLIGDIIASAFVLNQTHDEGYANGNWQYNNLSYSVLHRLCVNPECQNKGVGTKTMKFIEDTLRNENIQTIRLDAFSQNPSALRLYEKLGYIKVGKINFRNGLFYLFEKRL